MAKMNEYPLLSPEEGIPLFYPHIPKNAEKYVADTLKTRWIGQGPQVDRFEQKFKDVLKISNPVISVNSGTAALHLSYILAGVKQDSEVICPLFTCTATNLAILYQGGTPVFIDIASDCLNMDATQIEEKITDKTVAITFVDYGGLPNNYELLRNICDKHGLKLIADCAHALDTYYNGKHVSEYADYVIYSFQAIKSLTTGDGGMLLVNNQDDYIKARELRWFGIDREAKQAGNWKNDIHHIGYKYHMNDISAAIGLAALEELDETLKHRRDMYQLYIEHLEEFSQNLFESPQENVSFTPWLVTINTKGKRIKLVEYLRSKSIESAQVHYRNDIYSVFKPYIDGVYTNMDAVENDYLVLPLHTKVSSDNVKYICHEIKSFFRNN